MEENNAAIQDRSGAESEISPPTGRRRRCRTHFGMTSLRRLEEEFAIDPYPDVTVREALANELNVTEDRIQVWFQNRRSKHRRLTANPIAKERRISSLTASLHAKIISPNYHDPISIRPFENLNPSPPLESLPHKQFNTAVNPLPNNYAVLINSATNSLQIGGKIKTQDESKDCDTSNVKQGQDLREDDQRAPMQTSFKPRRPWEDADAPTSPNFYSNSRAATGQSGSMTRLSWPPMNIFPQHFPGLSFYQQNVHPIFPLRLLSFNTDPTQDTYPMLGSHSPTTIILRNQLSGCF